MPSDFIGDISTLRPSKAEDVNVKSTNKKAGMTDLDTSAFLQLMVAQFQNQDPQNAADSSDMLNQLMQMTVIQAVNNITDASTMMYSASLVGKDVTIGQYDAKGKLEEIVGQVTATGTYGGKPVVFIGDKSYYLSDIMAVGRLPEAAKTDETKPTDTNPTDTNPTDPANTGENNGENGGDGDSDENALG